MIRAAFFVMWPGFRIDGVPCRIVCPAAASLCRLPQREGDLRETIPVENTLPLASEWQRWRDLASRQSGGDGGVGTTAGSATGVCRP